MSGGTDAARSGSAPRVPPGQIVTHGFPVLHAGTVPSGLDRTHWTLKVHGRVEAPAEWNFESFAALGEKEETVDIHCVTSWTKLGTTWRGVPFRAIAAQVRPAAEVRFVVMECEQGFTTSLPLEALMDEDVLIVHTYAGEPLAAEHGGPVRMLVPKRYFYKSAKWLRGLKFVVEDEPGFWEVRGYSNVADPWKQTRYDVDDVREIHRMRKQNLFQRILGP